MLQLVTTLPTKETKHKLKCRKTNPKAKKFDSLSYIDVLKNNLKVMDSTAISLCMDNDIPIIVFSLFEKENIKNIIKGENLGTTIGGKKDG